jgi:enolase-phosphatase E1
VIFSLAAAPVRGIVLDIEGTTTPISFVYDVLFPYARARVAGYLKRSATAPGVRADVHRLCEEHTADVARGSAPPPWVDEPPDRRLESAAAYVCWLMEQDRKSTGLKSVQGRIYEEGYRAGHLKSCFFDDVSPALERWARRGLDVRIFSSGSALAQRLLFAHGEAGDLTRFLRGYFDTTTGSKTDPASYRRIAEAMRLAPAEILFISDVTAELDAAASAGMRRALCVRPGNPPQPPHPHFTIHAFSEIAD